MDLGGGMIFPDAYLRPQFSPAEEDAHDAQERAQEHMEDFGLADLEPDFDPYPEEAA